MNFSEDWFTEYIPDWEKYVLPRLQHHPLRFLEIGSFEGHSAAWLLAHALVDPRDRLVCVDPFESYEGHAGYEATFGENMREIEAGERLVKIKGYSQNELKDRRAHNSFDGVYIDGSHATIDVLRDAVLAFDLVKVGGFILFDDYRFARDEDHVVKTAIDAFLACYGGHVRVVFCNRQLMVERIR